jgi:hypothetical protein
MKYQDLPMLCVLTIGFLIRLISGDFDLVCVCFIGVTASSALFNYLSMITKRE